MTDPLSSKPMVYCPDEGVWPLEWPSEVVALADFERLKREHAQLRGALKEAIDYVEQDSEHPTMLNEWTKIVLNTG